MKQAHNTVKICSFLGASIVCIMFLSSCASYPHVSTGNPKVYNDGQTRMLLDKLYEDTRSNVPSITDTTPQIISRIRQEYNRLLTIKANTSGMESAESTGSKLKYDPMATPTDAATSLGFTQILRERIRRQQDISRHEMLYIGDQSFLDENKSIYLIRMDITLMYAHTSAIRKYLVLDFSINPADEAEDISDKIRIYALAPDYASTISEDSLISLGMKTLNGMVSGNIEGVDVSVERNLEKQLEQYFTSTNESPLQFAIPRDASQYSITNYEWYNPAGWDGDVKSCDPPRPGFSFGFGPQRHITKRRWFNPMSWFGDTYVVEYEYMPVTADCYALVVADKSMIGKDLNIIVKTFPLCDMKSGFNCKVEKTIIGTYKISLANTIEPNESVRLKKVCEDAAALFQASLETITVIENNISEYKKETEKLDTERKSLKEKQERLDGDLSDKEEAKLKNEIKKQEEAIAELEKSLKEKKNRLHNQRDVVSKNIAGFYKTNNANIEALSGSLKTDIYPKYETCQLNIEKLLKNIETIIENIDNAGKSKVDGKQTEEINVNVCLKNLEQFRYKHITTLVSSIFPDSIDPSVDSTIIIQTHYPVNSSSVVSVHGIEIASANISILGRKILKVKIPANKVLQSFSKEYEVECVVMTPGFSGMETFYLTIINKEASVVDRTPSAPLTLTPTEGRAGETATISSSDKTDFPLNGIESIYVGNNKIPKEQFSYQDDSKIKFNLPAPGADIYASVGVFVLPRFTKSYSINFKYKVPLTGGGNP